MIYGRVEQSRRLGLCLDTAHAFAAGYDLKSEIGLDSMLNEIDELLGIDQIEVIHFNESKKDFSSRLDQHENIGRGKIGLLALQRIIKHHKLRNSVFILETPRYNKDDDKMNLSITKKLAK